MRNQIILGVLFTLMLSGLDVIAQKAIKSAKFKKKHSSSISRVSLFKKNSTLEPTLLWSQFDATKRGSVIAMIPDENGHVTLRVLAENTPDVAVQSIAKISGKVGYEKLSAESVVEISRSIAQIKRSSAVENFRTLSYRVAELSNRDGTLDPDVKSLLEQLIEAAVKTSKLDNDTTMKEYEAILQKQKNKAMVLEKYNAELEKETDDTKKKAILDKMAEIVN